MLGSENEFKSSLGNLIRFCNKKENLKQELRRQLYAGALLSMLVAIYPTIL